MNGRTGWLAVLTIAALVAFGCSGGRQSPVDQMRASAGPGEFRIGIMTGAAAHHADEFRAAQQLAKKYGARVRHITYPDDYELEQETIVAQLTGLAADPDMRVIVVGEAVPGAVEAAQRIRMLRPDVLIGFVAPHQDAALVNGACDLAVGVDQAARGRSLAAAAVAMGVKTIVYYTAAGDSLEPPLARQRALMNTEARQRGLAFEGVDQPAANGHALDQFYDADVARALAAHGAATGFYATDPAAEGALIRAVLGHGGYLIEGADPSPLAGLADALDASVPAERADDPDFVAGENRRAAAAHDRAGHFGAWSESPDMIAIRAVTNVLVDAVEKQVDYRDRATVLTYLRVEAGPDVKLRKFDEASGNQYLMTLAHVVF